MNTPLSRLRRLPPALFALTRFGQGDNASARCKPEHGVRWGGLLRGHWCGGVLKVTGLVRTGQLVVSSRGGVSTLAAAQHAMLAGRAGLVSAKSCFTGRF